MPKIQTDFQTILKTSITDPQTLDCLYRFLANSIKKAHNRSSVGWVLYVRDGGIVFSIRNVYALSIGVDFGTRKLNGVRLMAAKNLVDEPLKEQLLGLGCSVGGEFKNTGGSVGVNIQVADGENFCKALELIRTAHEQYIVNVLKPDRSSSWRHLYKPEITEFLREATGDASIPHPAYYMPEGSNQQTTSGSQTGMASMNVFETIDSYLKAEGYHFLPEQIATFYTALQTKGFVILSGISGTGKTKLAQYFARMLQQPAVALVGALAPPDRLDDSTYPIDVDAAEYWTFPIREDVQKGLQLPFRLYLNRNNAIQHFYTVSDYQTQAGSQGMPSPWPDITDPRWKDRDHEEGNRYNKYKTWFRVSRREKIDQKLTFAQLKPLFGYSNDPGALRGGLVPVLDPLAESDNLLFLSVRPDWRDSKSLLGYYNPLTKHYEGTEFLRFLIKARKSYEAKDGRAWFVILDEMNLARVEYYFADLLSVLESGRDDEGYTREALRFQYPKEAEGELPPAAMTLPPNLYIVGTVNVDETTHAFSPKVLDRAFSLEFSEVDFDDYTLAEKGEMPLWDPQELLQRFTREGDYARIDKEDISQFVLHHPEVKGELQALNLALQPYQLHFGYRVFDEIMMFLRNAEANGWMGDAFDHAVLMKVLPKFNGSRGKLEKPLQAVLGWCVEPEHGEETLKKTLADLYQPINPDEWRYPATVKRVLRMLQSLAATGFASFG